MCQRRQARGRVGPDQVGALASRDSHRPASSDGVRVLRRARYEADSQPDAPCRGPHHPRRGPGSAATAARGDRDGRGPRRIGRATRRGHGSRGAPRAPRLSADTRD